MNGPQHPAIPTSCRRQSGGRRASGVTRLAVRSTRLERLEARVVLDAELSTPVACTPIFCPAMSADIQNDPSPVNGLQQFGSADELQDHLIDVAVNRYAQLFGQPGWPNHWWWGPGLNWGQEGDATAGPATNRSHSDTNVQVAGVDEGDIVETDGEFLYVLTDNRLSVIDVRAPEAPQLAWHTDWETNRWPSALFLHEDRLTVISSGGGWWGVPFMDVMARPSIPPDPSEFQPPHVTTTVYDVSDATQPTLVQKTEVDGWLYNARSIDGKVYLVVNDSLQLPPPDALPVDPPADPTASDPIAGIWPPGGPGEWGSYIYETEAEYRARMEALPIDLPDFATYGPDGTKVSEGDLFAATDLYRFTDEMTDNLLSIVTIDSHVAEAGPHAVTSILADGGSTIYMTPESLYVFSPRWNLSEQLSILKFDVNSALGTVEPVARGSVTGRILNQFSADEFNGHLRIATTEGWGTTSLNHVSVLAQTGDALQVIGSVDIAPGESIFSARFLGDQAYVVTFLRVDPLYRIDLSDPTQPRVVGELEVPGFSDYLQQIDPAHLLAIGRGADPNTGMVTSLQVSLFNIAEANPSLVDRYDFPGGNSSWSTATFDHHAFSYFSEYDTLAIPVDNYVFDPIWLADGRHHDPNTSPHGLYVLRVDPESGIRFEAVVNHPTSVLRSVRVGSHLVSVSSHMVKIVSLDAPDVVVGELIFREGLPHIEPPTDQHVDTPGPEATVLDVSSGAAGVSSSLETPGDRDVFQLRAPESGELHLVARGVAHGIISSNGDSDPAQAGLEISVLDDRGQVLHRVRTGTEHSAQLEFAVTAGTLYYISVAAVDANATGDYSFSVGYPIDDTGGGPVDGNPDVNGDGAIDAADAARLFSVWGKTEAAPTSAIDFALSDINGDGIIDAADAGILFERWTGDVHVGSIESAFAS